MGSIFGPDALDERKIYGFCWESNQDSLVAQHSPVTALTKLYQVRQPTHTHTSYKFRQIYCVHKSAQKNKLVIDS